jgi:hypothetical protein
MKTNVAIFPAGSDNAVDAFEALRYNVNLSVYGVTAKSDHAEFAYPKERLINGDFYITSPDFIERFNSMLKRNAIDIVIPAHDTVALFLARNRDRICADVLVPEEKTALICHQKSLTYALFSDCFFCPGIFAGADSVPADAYPVFLKPDVGGGSKGTHIAEDRCDLEYRMRRDPGLLIVEYLPGAEYTVDCFSSSRGELMFTGARTRERIENGIAVRSRSIPTTADIAEIARTINSRLRFTGAWYFQLKQAADGRLKLLEVSCRIAGTMTLYRHKGVNLALLSVYALMGRETAIIENPGEYLLDRQFHARYKLAHHYDTVYLDYDDTLVVDGCVNKTALRLLYQWAESGIKVYLLTRHTGEDIRCALRDRKIHEGLFAGIIQFGFDQEKAALIRSADSAIFIDNSFAERQSVCKKHGIPVFDVDAIDCLIQE